ncbi:MAG: mechanosensitive ion channel, partial [Cytophagales bacterium]|nr:mechanosensitive ion channel [Cytophagales bacterium]
LATGYAPKILGAILVVIAGFWLVGKVVRLIDKGFEKRDFNPTLRLFLKNIFSVALKIVVLVTVMGMLDIATTPIIASLGAVGLAIGLALQGTLQNFAGGIIILVLKPFRVGDFIEAEGNMGVVNEIQLFNTVVLTLDNKTVVFPNSKLSGNVVVNYTAQKLRRVDLTLGIGYGADVEHVRGLIVNLIENNKLVLHQPEAPFVGLHEMADSSVNLTLRVWTKTEDYWELYFYLNEAVYNQFNKQGVTIPFPQLDIHIKQDEKVLQ